jgi:hypothetical protein
MKAKILAFTFFSALFCTTLNAQNETNHENSVGMRDIIASCKTSNLAFVQRINFEYMADRSQLAASLLAILADVKSPNLNRCVAAYYLGEMRSTNAMDLLLNHITLRLDMTRIPEKGWVKASFLESPATDALIKIGSSAIPAVIRNLAESDDAKVRELSLAVLYRIEGDKDVVQLRLQKALAAEKDSQKQARLQAALKALAETSLAN